MKIAILFIGDLPREVADVCYRSIRKYMDCPIVHQTDMTTEKLWFADEVQRLDETNLQIARLSHMSQTKGEVLSLDYDTVVQKDVSYVFKQDFHVALTKRKAVKGSDDYLLNISYPHNLGVIFSKSRNFWLECLKAYRCYPETENFMLIQVCVTETAHIFRDKFKVLELDAEKYNYSPEKKDEDLSSRYIVHYKGHRKHWMADTKHAVDEGERIVELTRNGKGYFSQYHPYIKEILEAQKEEREHNRQD